MESIRTLLLSLYTSPHFEYLIQIANRAYLGGGQQARDFIIKKLDFDSYLREEAWTHLLTGIKENEIVRLRDLLKERESQITEDDQ